MIAWGAKVKTTTVLALVAAAVCMNEAAAQSTMVGVVNYGVDSTHPLLRGCVDYPRGYNRALNQRQGVDHATMVASNIVLRIGAADFRYLYACAGTVRG